MRLIYFTDSVLSENGLEHHRLKISPAGNYRSRYIIEAIKKCKKITNIIFLSRAHGTAGGIQHQIERTQNELHFKEIYLGYLSIGFIQWLTSVISTTFWFLKNTTRQDIVIVYNFLPRTAIPIIFSMLFRNYKLIIQFDELYGYMDSPYHHIFRILERFSIQNAIGFITPSHHIADKIRKYRNNDVCIVMSYGYPTITELSHQNLQSSKRLQLLYSGTLGSERGVCELIDLLPYVKDFADLTITGKGPFSTIIERLSQTNDNLKYIGYVTEDHYLDVLSKMQVCINPTPIDSDFSKYSFPSKVVSYISNSKIVLSTPLDVIKSSPYRDIIIYYDENDPISFRKILLDISNNFDKLSNNMQLFSKQLEKIKDQEYLQICDLVGK
jgi:glycosyltransferase involved in cell wall biosynthesis